MKYFSFKITPELEETLDNIFSCLLPHDNFNIIEAKGVMEELERTISVNECTGVYYIFLKAFSRLSVARMYLAETSTILRRDMFDHAVSGSITDLILQPAFDAQAFFMSYGRTFELSVPSQLEEAASFAYTEAMNKYDELFEKAVATSEGLVWVNLLKQRMEEELTKKMLSTAANILVEGKTEDKNLRRGATESRRFLSEALTDVNQRITSIFTDLGSRTVGTTITSFNASKQFDEKNRITVKDLYYTGIDPLDIQQPIRTQDIVTVVADEGVGKTRFAVDQAYKALMSGVNVLYICGETAQVKIKGAIEAAHIYNKYQLQLKLKEIEDPTTIKDATLDQIEDISIKINAALVDLFENPDYGKLTLMQSANYEEFEEQIRHYCDKASIDLVIVDHVLALRSTGAFTTYGRLTTKQMRVSYLYECEDCLVKECNLAFLNTSHPSVETSTDMKQGRAPGARSGAASADSTKYSSIVCVLNNTVELRKQDMVLMYITKLRDEPNIADTIVLKRLGYTNIHLYDPKYQYLGEGRGTGKMDITDDLFISEE